MSDRWQPLPECYSIELTGTRSLSDTCPTGYTGCLHAMSPWCDRTKCIHCLFKKVHCSSYSRDCYRSSPKWTRTTSHPGAPSKSYAWGKLSFQSYYGNRIPGSDRIQTNQLISEAVTQIPNNIIRSERWGQWLDRPLHLSRYQPQNMISLLRGYGT